MTRFELLKDSFFSPVMMAIYGPYTCDSSFCPGHDADKESIFRSAVCVPRDTIWGSHDLTEN